MKAKDKIIGLTLVVGERMNLDGAHFKIKSIDKYREGIFVGLDEIPPKRPVKHK